MGIVKGSALYLDAIGKGSNITIEFNEFKNIVGVSGSILTAVYSDDNHILNIKNNLVEDNFAFYAVPTFLIASFDKKESNKILSNNFKGDFYLIIQN